MGRFSVEYNRGCDPFTVNIIVNDTFGAVTRQYVYEEGQTETNATTYTYTSPGSYEIIQIISNVNPRTDTLAIEVIEPTIPEYIIYSCASNAARIEIDESTYDFYRIFYNNDSVQVNPNSISPILNFPNSNNQTIRIRGYYNDAEDNCGETSFVYSPLQNIAQPAINDVSYDQSCIDLISATLNLTITNSVRHLVEFSSDGSTFQAVDTAFNTDQITIDGLNFNSTTVFFRVSAIDECTSNTILPATFELTEIPNAIDPITNINASYDNKNVQLVWEEPLFTYLEYDIYQSRNQAAFSLVGTASTNTFTDTGLNPDINLYQYQIISSDTCGNTSSTSITATPTYLSFDQEQGNFYNLFWNSYEGWISGIAAYNLQTLAEDGTPQDEFTIAEQNQKLLNITNLPGNRFRIRIISVEGGFQAYSNTITLAKSNTILIPDAFSPNGDGINDEIRPILNSSDNFEFLIYNKWGELVFQSTNVFVGWDGIYRNRVAASGTYIYRIKYENEEGEVINQSGSFILLR
ncbi:MAG: gliding motility-associated C-terminal domain-containing protein [bacterium]|nr:gliding motility-associated C-terminal domain-containing protein [bacterium]